MKIFAAVYLFTSMEMMVRMMERKIELWGKAYKEGAEVEPTDKELVLHIYLAAKDDSQGRLKELETLKYFSDLNEDI